MLTLTKKESQQIHPESAKDFRIFICGKEKTFLNMI